MLQCIWRRSNLDIKAQCKRFQSATSLDAKNNEIFCLYHTNKTKLNLPINLVLINPLDLEMDF